MVKSREKFARKGLRRVALMKFKRLYEDYLSNLENGNYPNIPNLGKIQLDVGISRFDVELRQYLSYGNTVLHHWLRAQGPRLEI